MALYTFICLSYAFFRANFQDIVPLYLDRPLCPSALWRCWLGSYRRNKTDNKWVQTRPPAIPFFLESKGPAVQLRGWAPSNNNNNNNNRKKKIRVALAKAASPPYKCNENSRSHISQGSSVSPRPRNSSTGRI